MLLSAVSVVLGLMALAALGLSAGKIYLGLGRGGMECIVAYPVLMWEPGSAATLIAYPEERKTEQRPQ